jgi:hypothetical protein
MDHLGRYTEERERGGESRLRPPCITFGNAHTKPNRPYSSLNLLRKPHPPKISPKILLHHPSSGEVLDGPVHDDHKH